MEANTNKDTSRASLLDAALEQLWTKGYNGTRVDEIIENTAFTKGAFYHHFPSKKALVAAIIEETIGSVMEYRWLEPLEKADDPFAAIIARLNEVRHDGDEGIRRGCILNNLAQELSHTDEELRDLLNRKFGKWISGFAQAIAVSKAKGQVRADVDPDKLATYIVASYEGAVSLAKAARSADTLNIVLDHLIAHLETLRTPQ
jgi:AcrR family transcriptional regulator